MSVEGPLPEPEAANRYHEIVAQTRKNHQLLSVHWELTYRCNEKCTHCYLDVLAPRAEVPGELTTAECCRVIDELAQLGVLNLSLSGGEILVRSDLFTIAEYARTRRMLLRLFTNGILITPTVADRIAALHPYAVEISLYSTRPEVHNGITRLNHSWELTTRALRLLHMRGVRTRLKTPMMRENVHEIHALRALAQDLGAQFLYDLIITAQDTGGLGSLKHRLTYDDLVWLLRQELDPEVWLGRRLTNESLACGIALNALALDPFGNVYPCVQTRTLAGNIRQHSLEEIWTRSPVWEQLGHLTWEQLPVCRGCELRNLCVRCHGLAQLEDGELRGPASANCTAALARRHVLIEKGCLPGDFPIPPHLQGYARQIQKQGEHNELANQRAYGAASSAYAAST